MSKSSKKHEKTNRAILNEKEWLDPWLVNEDMVGKQSWSKEIQINVKQLICIAHMQQEYNSHDWFSYEFTRTTTNG